jgi:transposase
MPARAIPRVELSMDELEEILREAQRALSAEHYAKLEQLVHSFAYLTELLEDKQTTIATLRRLLFGPPSETSRTVLGEPEAAVGAGPPAPGATEPSRPAGDDGAPAARAPRKGHGRRGAEAYTGAERIAVAHATLQPRDRCPGCLKGKIYRVPEPRVLVRLRGQAPLAATVWELERLRCNLCGEVFTAPTPAGVGEEKYDAAAKAMIALLRYGSGFPFTRLEKLESNLGIPLPASTQWEMAEELAEDLDPAFAELIRQAAQGEVVYNDDTPMRILQFVNAAGGEGDDRTGVFTSGIVSLVDGQRVAMFFTGRQHAGENLGQVLQARAPELGPPIQMCDALSRNVPASTPSRLANCLAHGRRKFVELMESFPPACRTVLESLRQVYRTDHRCAEQKLSPDARLRRHQAESGPVMETLHAWMEAQFTERTVEPNSGLGKAISYMLNHWPALTLFLREPGAPLDNNLCERALKKAILHRNNSLFYKTPNGARVGDLFMSLIHTCELGGVNAFDYLVALQQHADELAARPADWMPWNYRAALERLDPP